MSIKTGAIGAAVLFGLFACSRGVKQTSLDENMVDNNAPITLQVTNDNPQDVDVFVAGEEQARQRIGMVTSGQTQTFTVPATALHGTSSLQLLVHPIGGGGDYSSGPVNVSPGDRVELHVAPMVMQTSYMIAQRSA